MSALGRRQGRQGRVQGVEEAGLRQDGRQSQEPLRDYQWQPQGYRGQFGVDGHRLAEGIKLTGAPDRRRQCGAFSTATRNRAKRRASVICWPPSCGGP